MNYRHILAGAAVACLIANPAFAKTDKEFLSDAIKGDNSEVALGQLAAQKGTSEGVKSFGSMLATDHGKAKEEVVAVAKSMGVEASDELKPEAREEMAKLEKLSGAEFDKEFAAYMVKDHKKDIAEFKEKAADGKNEVSTLAAKQLPTLEKHLETAESLAKM